MTPMVDHVYRGFTIERNWIIPTSWQVRDQSGRVVIFVVKTLAEARASVDSYIREPWPGPSLAGWSGTCHPTA